MGDLIKNTADLIRKDCVIYHEQGVITPDEIYRRVTTIKFQLHQYFQGDTVGKNVMIFTNDFGIILPAMIAIWEMGASVVVHDFQIGYQEHPSFREFYSYIDLLLLSPDKPQPKSLPYVYFNDSVDAAGLDIIIDVDPDSSAVKTHSSGTTGAPKIIDISHKHAIELVKKNIEIFEFNEDDRVLHYKTLHHGSLFLNYAVPALATTTQHFFILKGRRLLFTFQNEDQGLNFCLNYCKENSITTWLVPYNFLTILANRQTITPIDLDNTRLITAIGPSHSEMRQIFDKFNPVAVYNNFGCTELGTLFVSKTTKENLDKYQPNRFDIFNDLVEIEIDYHYFLARYQGQTKWQKIGDILEKKQSEILWHGRCDVLKGVNQWIKIWQIVGHLEKMFGHRDFSVIPDFELRQIYLAIFNQENRHGISLTEINQQLRAVTGEEISVHDLDWLNLDHYRVGIKPSNPLLLYFFRHKKSHEFSEL